MEVEFTDSGEIIGIMTYFKDPENGERDALLHFVEGGVYPKVSPQVVGEFKRTGDLMPVYDEVRPHCSVGACALPQCCPRLGISRQSVHGAVQSAPGPASRYASGGSDFSD